MTDRFKEAFDDISSWRGDVLSMTEAVNDHFDVVCQALTLATESEQLRKRLAELETLIEQANKKIQWYQRTEATND